MLAERAVTEEGKGCEEADGAAVSATPPYRFQGLRMGTASRAICLAVVMVQRIPVRVSICDQGGNGVSICGSADRVLACETMLASTLTTSRWQTAGRLLLGIFMTLAGVAHLTFQRGEFLAQVPPWVPLDPDFVVLASGVVEIALGLALLFLTRWKVWVGLSLAAFFVAIFPGNLSQYLNGIDAFGLDTDAKRFARLFFQPVLIAWALWSTGAWQAWRGAKR